MSAQSFVVKHKRSSKPARRSPRVPSTQKHLAQPVIKPTRNLPIQAKLTIGQLGDKYEQEADRVADQVMRMSDADVAQRVETGTVQPMRIQRMCAECEEEVAQRQPEEEEEELQAKEMPGQTPTVAPNLESRINSLKGPGRLLDPVTRNFFEPRFGHDFSNVRIHTGSNASETTKSVNARAFTLGNNMVFGSGEYRPESKEGRYLLGHELTHVIQQRSNGLGCRLSRKVVDTDYYVTCRESRPNAISSLKVDEGNAKIAALTAALQIHSALAMQPLIAMGGFGSAQLSKFQDVLWRRFHLDFNSRHVRIKTLPLLAKRYELIADWIGRLNHRYVCGALGTEPTGSCTLQPGKGEAWTALGIPEMEICDSYWNLPLNERGLTMLHEWFHFGWSLGDCKDNQNFTDANCYDAFAGELSGFVGKSHYDWCCKPPKTPPPPLSGKP